MANSPSSLITEDKWGCLPILYAIWGGVPEGITSFLIDEHKSAFPNHVLNWDKMVETLCRAGASLDTVKRLLDIQQSSFSDQIINWQKAARELTIRFIVAYDYSELVDDDGEEIDWKGSFFEDMVATTEALRVYEVHQDLIQYLLEIQEQLFADQNNVNLQTLCEELAQALTGWWQPNSTNDSMCSFQFLVKCSIPERLNAIGVRKWRMNIKQLVETIPSVDSDQLDTHFDTIHSKLVSYEVEYQQLKDAAFLLELGLWKLTIDASMQGHLEDDTAADLRGQCRINCGADIIIPNVLPYLIGSHNKRARHE